MFHLLTSTVTGDNFLRTRSYVLVIYRAQYSFSFYSSQSIKSCLNYIITRQTLNFFNDSFFVEKQSFLNTVLFSGFKFNITIFYIFARNPTFWIVKYYYFSLVRLTLINFLYSAEIWKSYGYF